MCDLQNIDSTVFTAVILGVGFFCGVGFYVTVLFLLERFSSK